MLRGACRGAQAVGLVSAAQFTPEALAILWIVKPRHTSVIGWWLPGTGGAG